MKAIIYTITLTFFLSSLIAGGFLELSERSKPAKTKYGCRASRDGLNLLKQMSAQQLPSKLLFATFKDTNQITPSSIVIDPENSATESTRQRETTLKIIVQPEFANLSVGVPERIEWKELIPRNDWQAPIYTAYKSLTDGDFDPFAYDGEVAFIFDATKQGRSQFTDVHIVPDGWSSHVTAAASWCSANNHLFDRKSLSADDLLKLKHDTTSNSPLIRKMAMSLLMKQKAASSNEKKAWLKAESSMVDVAVLTQLLLSDDPQLDIMVSPAWMVEGGERLWGGALIGATLLFTANQEAVNSMMFYHAKMQKNKQVPTDDIMDYKKTAMKQVGYATIEGIGTEMVRNKTLPNYPIFSAANDLFKVSMIIPPALLFTEPPK